MATNENSNSNKKESANLDQNGLLKPKHVGENSNQDKDTINTTQNDNISNNIEAPLDQGDSIDFVSDTNLFQKRRKDIKEEGDNNDPDFDHTVSEKEKK